MIDSILLALWFFLPAGVANAAPTFANKLPVLKKWKTPIDLGKTYRGKRVFGNNKTFRGFFFGVLAAVLTAWLQLQFFKTVEVTDFWATAYSMNHYFSNDYLLLGALLGAGALLGDMLESFLKRQRDVPSGESWFPFDQIDYIVGGLLLGSFVTVLRVDGYLLVLGVWFGMHLLFAYIGYLLGLKDKPI